MIIEPLSKFQHTVRWLRGHVLRPKFFMQTPRKEIILIFFCIVAASENMLPILKYDRWSITLDNLT